jgi:hypothetical protein
VWRLPGSLLWLPTAVNGLIAVEIFQIWWERWGPSGHLSAGTAQAELGPFFHILIISAPISIALLLGWAVVAVMRQRVPSSADAPKGRGATILVLANVVAPIPLLMALQLT